MSDTTTTATTSGLHLTTYTVRRSADGLRWNVTNTRTGARSHATTAEAVALTVTSDAPPRFRRDVNTGGSLDPMVAAVHLALGAPLGELHLSGIGGGRGAFLVTRAQRRNY